MHFLCITRYDVVNSICKNLKNIIGNDTMTDDRLALLNDLIIHCDQELCSEFISDVR